MFELKSLSRAAIERSLAKAERYRLLNQPWAAESICLDVLRTDPANQQAVHALLLARTEQFGDDLAGHVAQAREALTQLTSDYERAYYAGIIAERIARTELRRHVPGAGHMAYDHVREAMEWFEKAEALRPQGNDDSILRWNSCARLLNESTRVVPRPIEREQVITGE
ncbi:MAG TPA: hypothetical protein VFG84_01435 [Gemmatimonadaceae bacterium]|nr:hypothetical protein [Gemmatimonadaceae bacterium]